ncbi:hypothetical protein Q4506_08845 [Colwellia sp. 4_MG-2023]|uniref:hypothetical protein n=1 Tax=unclassified Colwellia TaxID=196834 RepID=UPI0026E34193|nr:MULTISPECIES: hypothetical protein [unclassified Colwellia]MDO6506836.1 hypothetical protein [Colwellia sp. 5_MG-2023]MDO6555789.1 hypothetical protein [Colwellia sp. 4_MG-2023]
MKSVAILSCWFGYKYNKPLKINSFSTCKRWLYATIKNRLPFNILEYLGFVSIIPQAPKDIEHCYFYSNNKRLEKEVLFKGWRFCFVESELDNGESITSSLLAKQVKFLQVNDINFNDFEHLIYMDSRRISDDIANIIRMNQKGILIRYEAKFKPTIWHEVEEAKGQQRYVKHMDKTIDFINAKLEESCYSPNNRVMNTGIIAYSMNINGIKIKALCNEVYEACIKLEQPECQIFWCLLSQPYMNLIEAVESTELKSRSGL